MTATDYRLMIIKEALNSSKDAFLFNLLDLNLINRYFFTFKFSVSKFAREANREFIISEKYALTILYNEISVYSIQYTFAVFKMVHSRPFLLIAHPVDTKFQGYFFKESRT